jgi:hypothetical protein
VAPQRRCHLRYSGAVTKAGRSWTTSRSSAASSCLVGLAMSAISATSPQCGHPDHASSLVPAHAASRCRRSCSWSQGAAELASGKPTDPLWREGVDGGTDCDGESADVVATATATFPVTAVRDHLGGGRAEKGNGRAGAGSARASPNRFGRRLQGSRARNRIAPLPAAHNRASKDPEPCTPDQEGRATVGRRRYRKGCNPDSATLRDGRAPVRWSPTADSGGRRTRLARKMTDQ